MCVRVCVCVCVMAVFYSQHLNRKYNVQVPLVLMNSFNTQAETLKVKHKYERRVPLYMFEQSCYPRINQETLRPLPEDTTIRDGQ